MKSRLDIWQCLLIESGKRCSVDSTTHDLNTVVRRVASEGESFFTHTLPAFGKDLERSLEEGCIPKRLFRGYARTLIGVKVTQPEGCVRIKKGRWGTPKFLGGFLDQIFDTNWEVTHDEWSTAINAVYHSQVPDHNFFPPVLRIPQTQEEEVRMAEAIRSIRQLTLAFSKEKDMPDEPLVRRAVESYVDVDEELGELLYDPKEALPQWQEPGK